MFSVYAQNPNFDDPLSALHLGEMPEGVVGPGQVRVQLKAASLNWHDLRTLRGVGMRPLKFPSAAKAGKILLSQCAVACVLLYERRHSHERG